MFPQSTGVLGCNDITPRVGVAYDVFGNGKTALKFNLGRYLEAAVNDNGLRWNVRIVGSSGRSRIIGQFGSRASGFQQKPGARVFLFDTATSAADDAEACGALMVAMGDFDKTTTISGMSLAELDSYKRGVALCVSL
ncbi:MAG: hypothetical protein ABJA98_15240 [Acidobacteriota bacterium]